MNWSGQYTNVIGKAWKFALKTFTHKFEKYDGTMTEEIERFVFDRGDSCAVILHDVSQDTVTLTEQFRVGVAANEGDDSPWVIEAVAGSMDVEGEAPEQTILREIEEETPGIKVMEVTKICEYYPSPGACSEKMFLFYAKVDSREVEETGGLEDHVEDIKPLQMPVDEAFRLLEEGKLNTSTALIGLQWMRINRLNTAMSDGMDAAGSRLG